MTISQPNPPVTSYACHVFPADDIYVTSGANLGDGIGELEDLCAGDIYQIDRKAVAFNLQLAQPRGQGRGRITEQSIAPGSDIGSNGEAVAISLRLTLIAPDGNTVDLLVLRHHGADGTKRYAMPLAPMAQRIDYTLIKVEANPTDVRLSDIICVSFTRGTMITMAGGQQVAIETLTSGDRLLTRDHGAQPVRWIGKATLRALGRFAPVVITAGTLGNEGNLIVSQQHRIFLYHRNRPAGIKTAELLVQAKYLVDDEAVFLREGGFVDYFSLVFDAHEIIYAEGIPAESLMVNEATVSNLPDSLAEEVKSRFPGLSQPQHFGTEADLTLIDEIGARALYKKGLAR